jgi:hypothetical protein
LWPSPRRSHRGRAPPASQWLEAPCPPSSRLPHPRPRPRARCRVRPRRVGNPAYRGSSGAPCAPRQGRRTKSTRAGRRPPTAVLAAVTYFGDASPRLAHTGQPSAVGLLPSGPSSAPTHRFPKFGGPMDQSQRVSLFGSPRCSMRGRSVSARTVSDTRRPYGSAR